MRKKIILWTLIFLILINSALSLGIRPAKTVINFEPDLNQEYSFLIINNEGRDLNIKLDIKGSLKYYTSIEEKEIFITAEEKLKEVRFNLDLPQTLTPGLNLGEILVSEQAESDSTITANLQLPHKIKVLAPYPEKYVEVNVQLRMREQESDIIAEIINSGTEKINDLTTSIRVKDNRKTLKEIKTGSISLEPTKTKQYYLVLNNTELSTGEYDVFAQVLYDGEELEITRKLLAGEPRIEIINLDSFFLEKEINDLRIELKNKWNKKIKDVYAEVVVKRGNQEIYSGKSISFDLDGHQKKIIKTFLDLTSLKTGKADLYLTLNYNGKSETSHYSIDILTRAVFEKKIKEVQVITMPGGKFTMIIILILALLIFGIFLLISLPLLIKKIKEKMNPPVEYLKPKEKPKQPQQYQPPQPKQPPKFPEENLNTSEQYQSK